MYNKTCVLYHGLGSQPALSRTQLLNKAGYNVISELFDYDAEWDLDEGKSLFEKQLEVVKNVDLIIGISFGGYLGYQLSKATGKDLILINPALDRAKSKSLIKDFDIPEYNLPSNIEIFFGELDTTVPKQYCIDYLNRNNEPFEYHILEDMSHKVPDNYFKEILFRSKLIKMKQPIKLLITAGTTHEHIDPVRFISNASSGLQGLMLAKIAILRGCEVILIIGPNNFKQDLDTFKATQDIDNKLTIINVVSAEDMYAAAMEHFPSCDVAICSAAVGDYRVKNIATDKIKRNGNSITIELIPNPDIAKSLGEIKTAQKLIGFALETSNGIENAKAKIIKKNLDWVILNESNKDNPAFGADTNIVTIISKEGEINQFDKLSKSNIAREILHLINI